MIKGMLLVGFLVLGLISTLVGMLVLLAPDSIYKVNSFLNKKIIKSETLLHHRALVAILLIISGAVMVFACYRYPAFRF